MKKSFPLILTAWIVFSMGIGCGLKGKKKDAWQPVQQKKTPVVHIVQYPKETLSIIARWYTGDVKNWESLADANPNINPDLLSLGNEIFIPEHLVKTRKPMPNEFISKFYQTSKQKEAPTKAAEAPQKEAPQKEGPAPLPKDEDEDEFEIFGPK